MSRASWILAAITLAASNVPSAEGSVPPAPPPVELRVLSRTVEAEPGQPVTTILQLSNPGPTSRTVRPSIAVPEGWSVITGVAALELAPDAAENSVLSIATPRAARAGRYIVRIAVDGLTDSPIDSLVVNVAQRQDLEIVTLEHPNFAIAGSSYRVRFRVRNRGNVTADVVLAARSAQNWAVALDVKRATLQPGSSVTATVHVAVPRDLARSTNDALEFEAVTPGGSARTTLLIPTVPAPGGVDEPTSAIPAQLRVALGNNQAGAAPVEFSGGGTLGADGRRSVDFMLRPRPRVPSVFSMPEEYRANIAGAGYRIQLGHQLYALSPLVSRGALGFGAGLQGDLGLLTLGGYAQRPVWGSNALERAAFAAIRPDESLRLTANAVDDGDARTVGGALRWNPGTTINLATEYARSSASGRAGNALHAQLNGRLGPMWYQLEKMTGDSAYVGAMRGEDFNFASLGFPLFRSIDASLSAARNSSLSTVQLLAGEPRDVRRTLSTASAAVSLGGRATVELVRVETDGTLWGPRQTGLEHGIRATASQRFRALTFSGKAELGAVNVDEGARRKYQLVGGTARLDRGRQSIAAYVEHDNGGSIVHSSIPITVAGADVALESRRGTGLVLGSMLVRPDAGSSSTVQLNGELSQRLAIGGTLALRVRVLGARSRREPFEALNGVSFEYRLPIGVPVGTRRARSVRGQVLESATGRPLVGALVQLGDQYAITDRAGRVSFAGLAPGAYNVDVQQELVRSHAVLSGDATVRVDSARRGATFRVAIAEGARVSGTVRRFARAQLTTENQPDSLIDEGPVPQSVIAAVNGRDTLYQVSDVDGRFEFSDLPPGAWTLSVASADVPDHQAFTPSMVSVTLGGGERREISFKLVPVRRPVKFEGGDSGVVEVRPRGGGSMRD